MANFGFITSPAVSGLDQSVRYQPTTATPFITPTWTSVLRAQQITDAIQVNHTPTGLETAEQGWLTGRRPVYGMKYPRGYYGD